ncbi:hypothetical protein COW46_04870 [Candidatus Gracilibacteria bacterium CG17_big_fil_post_rev_8_21_14_2_50_48_13]|nr:MAG: hypothetical protein COW46_04870 [Candidatus Gracilibacteria bacterium CG17_big_fil_post_rev_8_21_14_2_50_48_13]
MRSQTHIYSSQEGFESLVHEYTPALLRFVQRLANLDLPAAEDIVQDTFVTAWKYIYSFDPSYSVKAWLYRIARQQTVSAFRRTKNRPTGAYHLEGDEELLHSIASDIDVPSEVASKLMLDAIHEALGTLPEDLRAVLVLRFMDDMSYDDIADVLRKPPGTIATLLHRGKKQLAETLRRHYPSLVHEHELSPKNPA